MAKSISSKTFNETFTINRRLVIPPSAFTSTEIFEKEKEILFRRTWQFACVAAELKEPNDFVSLRIGGVPVVLQNLKGKIKAFLNVCSHRYAPIQHAPCGNRLLMCPYHGWQFDENGFPIGIPHNLQYYPISLEEKHQLCLKEFAVAQVGQFIFVNLGSDSSSFESQMGSIYPALKAMGSAMGSIYLKSTVIGNYNWKLGLHNSYDDTHAEFVHPTSLDVSPYLESKWDVFPWDEAEDLGRDYSRRHAEFKIKLKDDNYTKVVSDYKKYWPYLPSPTLPNYYHLVIWPNLLITSWMGYWYNIVQYCPISPTETHVRYVAVPARQWGTFPRADGGEAISLTEEEFIRDPGHVRLTPDFLYFIALASMQVFQEDISLPEFIQGGISHVPQPGIIGQVEDKIYNFERAYLSVMGIE